MKDEQIDNVLNQAAREPHPLDPHILARIGGSIEASTDRVRPLPPRWLMSIGIALLGAAVAVAGAARSGFFGIQKMDLPERLMVFSVLAILTWLAASAFVDRMIPASRFRVSPGALPALSSTVLLAVFAGLFRDYKTDHFISAGMVCLLIGVLHAVPAGLLGWLALRRGFAVNPVAAGLAAGTLAGLAGAGMLELHCPNFQAAHILVWHTAVVPVSAALGAWLAWTLSLRTRSRERSRQP